jgi:uncharacterized protein
MRSYVLTVARGFAKAEVRVRIPLTAPKEKLMIIDQIKTDRIQAMKDKDAAKKDLLGVLIAECTRNVKQPGDEFVISVVKKMHQNAHDNWERMSGTDDIRMGRYLQEEITLNGYIPAQLSPEAIEASVKHSITLGATSIRDVIVYFKENFEGRFDGKTVSETAKRLLT